MRIWLASPLPEGPADGDLGVFVPLGVPVPTAADRCLVHWKVEGRPPDGAVALLIEGTLVSGQCLAELDRPMLITVNGLGDQALAALRAATGAVAPILTIDARLMAGWHLFEQLAWLSGGTNSFAVMADASEVLETAAAMGAAHLIATGRTPVDIARLRAIAHARRPDAPRPLSAGEVDGVAGREACLTVNRGLAAGECISIDALATAVTTTRGIAPHLSSKLVGRRLRYPIEPGEPLTFGHLT